MVGGKPIIYVLPIKQFTFFLYFGLDKRIVVYSKHMKWHFTSSNMKEYLHELFAVSQHVRQFLYAQKYETKGPSF